MKDRAATQQEMNSGDILLGKYRVEEIIGVGGMGRVVKAQHLYLQQPVAIKLLLPQMVESQSTVGRFLREAQATVRLRSEHIARVMDVGTMPDGTPFMVMEYLEGHDLNQILRHHGPQMAQAVVDLILQACEGMAEAHAMGIVHRDIKPSNFFITRRPDGSNLLKILDFGISKTPAELSELTGTQTVIGTPTYMAPEQMVSARSTDPRSDIWSMGVVMYQLLAGRPPFEAETYAQLVLKVGNEPPAPLHIPLPPGLQQIVFRCLEKKPENRIQTVGELARMLAPYASDPLSAQQSAERAYRILNTTRGSVSAFAMSGSAAAGMGLTPVPQLTPKSWNATNGSSLNAGAGQVGTKVVRSGGRGLIIAGVATLCIAAGVGGFVIASSMKKGGDTKAAAHTTEETTTTTTPTTMTTMPSTATTPATATPTAGTTATGTTPTGTTPTSTTPTSTTPATGTVPTVPTVDTQKTAKTDTSKTSKTDTSKTAVKTDATKTSADATKTASTDATKTTKTASKSTKTKSTKTKSTSTKTKSSDSGGGLFDDRK